jgi:hypothetical protein
MLTAVTLLMLGSALPVIAAAHEYDAKKTSITATGKTHTFTAGEAVITCEKAEFKWTGTEGKHPTIDVTPAYSECTVLENKATVTVENGAQFEFGVPHELKPSEFSFTSSIVGGATAKLKVTAEIGGEHCEVVFPAQTLTGEATKFINNGLLNGGEVKSKLEKVEYKSNSKCAGFVGEKGKNGKYEGNAVEMGLIIE